MSEALAPVEGPNDENVSGGDMSIEPDVAGSGDFVLQGDVQLNRIRLKRFKQFSDSSIVISSGLTLVAGANNAGKSSLLQALAVWEFCKTAVVMERGNEGLLPQGVGRQGLGIGDEEFSPINLPSLKHLWTNLRTSKSESDPDGYTLSITCEWSQGGHDMCLGFALSLTNDRLFIRVAESTVVASAGVPAFAYLPPFAGMKSREERVGGAIRRRRTGEGVAGAVLRNLLLDMRQRNADTRESLRDPSGRISSANLRRLRESDPWELLQQAIREQFGAELQVSDFSEEYHSYIKIEVVKGVVEGFQLKKHPGYNARDLMVEGSGFLQWLNVYALAVSGEIDVLLLDEPDAHLHPALQQSLVSQLARLLVTNGKQALFATHSSEILRGADPSEILHVKSSRSIKYLTADHQKRGLLEGIGTFFSPKFSKVESTKRVFFYEGPSDLAVLQAVAKKMAIEWPEDMALIQTSDSHKDRALVWRALCDEYGDVSALSLRDRDEEHVNTVGEDLTDKSYNSANDNFTALKWRRRHIEAYLIWPAAVAAASSVPIEQVRQKLADQALAITASSFMPSMAPTPVLEFQAKEVLQSLGCVPGSVAQHLSKDSIPEDLKTVVLRVATFGRGASDGALKTS